MADLKKDLIDWLDKMEGVSDKQWFSNLRALIQYVPPELEGKVFVTLLIGKIAELEPNITNVKRYPENEQRLFKLSQEHGLLDIANTLANNPDLLKAFVTTVEKRSPQKKL